MKKIQIIIFAIFVVLNFSSCSSESEQENIIVDEASILQFKPEILKQYRDFNEHLLMDYDIDFRVITSNESEDVNTFANRRFNEIKSRSSSGKTILLVINVTHDKVRLEVSMGLEPIYTDAFVSYIERKGMIPYFRDSKVDDGVYMMCELIRDRATEASDNKEFMPPTESKSIGAGASVDSKIGQIDKLAKVGKNIESSLNDTPRVVLAKYFKSLKEHNKNPNLDIFTADTKKFFSNWTVTDINQDNELRFTSQCNDGKYYSSYDRFAVLVQPLKPRTCAPYLFKKEEGKWKLDIYTMAKVIRFNKGMMWHFDMNEKIKYFSNYEFAFQNLNYDDNGYPFYKQRKKLKWGFTCSPWYKPGEKEKIRCYITWLGENGRAKNDLGLLIDDRVMSVGKGSKKIENITLDDFMLYMKNTPKGTNMYVNVIRGDGTTKELNTLAQ